MINSTIINSEVAGLSADQQPVKALESSTSEGYILQTHAIEIARQLCTKAICKILRHPTKVLYSGF